MPNSLPQGHPPRFLSLEPILCCPNRRCRLRVFNVDADHGPLGLRCSEKKGCGTKWWATRLQPGNVRAQLLADLEGDEGPEEAVIDEMIRMYGLPEEISEPLWWQIPLSGHEWHHYVNERGAGVRKRSLGLLRRITGLFRAAS